MAFLNEQSIWEPGIYQLEQTDLVLGGTTASGSLSNLASEQLASRTLFLKNQLGRFGEAVEHTMPGSGNLTLDPEDIQNKYLVINVLTQGGTLNLNIDNLNFPDGGTITITARGLPIVGSPALRVQASGLQSGIATKRGVYDHFFMHGMESVVLVKQGGFLYIVSDATGADVVGDIVYNYRQPVMAVEARGQLLSRALYPRLWMLMAPSAIVDSTWLSSMNYCGAFSSGNGTTTFRMPDLRAMFLRSLDNGRGIDLGRPWDNPGGHEGHLTISHIHSINLRKVNISVTSNPGNVPILTPADVSGSGSTPVTVNTNQAPVNVGGNSEVRPRNVGYTAYIKY